MGGIQLAPHQRSALSRGAFMSEKNQKKPETRKMKSVDMAKTQKDEDVTDYPSAGEAETQSVPRQIREPVSESKLVDPRDDEFIPDAVTEDAAIEAASSEYVSFDQPLEEPPQRKSRKKSKSAKAPAPARKPADSRANDAS
jgi:hypothetical protein